MSSTSGRIAANAVSVLGMVIWSTNFPVSALILEEWQPLLLTPARLAAAALIAAVVAVLAGQLRDTVALFRVRQILLAGLAFATSSIFFVWGQKYTDPVAASVIVSSMPLISVIIGWLEGRERFTPALNIALILVIAGGAMTSITTAAGGTSDHPVLGSLLVMVGTVLYVVYSRIVTDYDAAPVIAKTAASMLVGTALAVSVTALALSAGIVPVEYDPSWRSIGLVVWLGAAVGVSSVMWFWVSRRIGVTVASMHNNLVPFYVILMAAFMGAGIGGQALLGAALVVAGAVLAQLPVFTPRPQVETGRSG